LTTLTSVVAVLTKTSAVAVVSPPSDSSQVAFVAA